MDMITDEMGSAAEEEIQRLRLRQSQLRDYLERKGAGMLKSQRVNGQIDDIEDRLRDLHADEVTMARRHVLEKIQERGEVVEPWMIPPADLTGGRDR